MIKIKLNDLNFRYDLYQIANIFYNFETIDFVDDGEDIRIDILDKQMTIDNKNIQKEISLIGDIPEKDLIKKGLFMFLKDITNKELPWGTLVGIRPSKIALTLLKEGLSESDIINYFNHRYLCSKEKAELCIDVAKAEENLINNERSTISVYIGMPFCPTRCLYCSFASNPIEGCKSLVEPYLSALSKEIDAMSKYINDKKLNIECVYFGGGTPTSINDEQFEETMKHLFNKIVKDNNVKEFTVECGRPDSITKNKLLTMKKYGVQRISINPQTMNDDTLRLIGRRHSVSDVIEKYYMARELGFDNINMDIIVGLNGENIEHIRKTCDKILELKPDNLTVHGMSIKRASRLHENIINNISYSMPNQKELNEMYKETYILADKLNMKPYYMYRQKNMVGNAENVGYSEKSKEGIYNIQMIEERQTIIALGADAVSKVVFLEENRLERIPNVKDVREYINRIDEMIERKIKLLNTLYK